MGTRQDGAGIGIDSLADPGQYGREHDTSPVNDLQFQVLTLRWRILALEAATLVSAIAMIVIMVLVLTNADRFVQRVDSVHRRFEVIAEIDGLTSKFAGQIAEVLLLGRDQMSDLQTVRLDLERAFARLSQVTRDEIATLTGMEAIQSELPELEQTRRMLELYHAIDRSAARVLVLQRDGQRDEALDVFQREVEFRLKNELAVLIGAGLDDERAEISVELARVEASRTSVLIGAGVTGALALVLVAGLGVLLRRSILRPLRSLSEGIEAIATGNLNHRLAISGTGELAGLAHRFNAMAEALGQHQQALVHAGERLSSDVEARTHQLQEANERLRDIDKRRVQFLADVSHELRTPLTILRGEADVALRTHADLQEQTLALERIQGQAVEMSQLLDDLISFARSDAEPQHFVFSELRLDDVLVAAVQEGETLAEPREVTLTLDLADDGSRVSGDFRRLKQAFLIGIDNAIKHSPPGGHIDIVSRLGQGDVAVQIMDQGPGVAAEDRARLFDRFYRGRNAIEPISEGLGIGLAIAKDIVERHQGTIDIDNRSGEGAILTITLPHSSGSAP